MCGIVGRVKYNGFSDDTYIIEKMTTTLKHRGPDSIAFFNTHNVQFGHTRLAIMDIENGKQPMSRVYRNKKYTIVYNGELYNSDEIKATLLKYKIEFTTTCDTEVLLYAYIIFGPECLNLFNGIYAFAIYDGNSVFIARDKLGVKPLYFSIVKKELSFASEIKALLKHPLIEATVDQNGIMELLGLGPTMSPGKTPYKNIHSLKPGHCIIVNRQSLKFYKYYDLKTKPHTDDLVSTIEKVRSLVSDSVKQQLQSDVGIATLLSGGLDSSVITAFASLHQKPLNTYSIDYKGNEQHFKSNDFQRSSDKEFARIVSKYLGTTHHEYDIDEVDLAELLEESMVARSLPAMADIDASLLWFANNISKQDKVVLSGECADEIFGGYPWFYRQEEISSAFPWLRNFSERKALFSEELQNLDFEGYINNAYNETVKNVTFLEDESAEDKRWRVLTYLNIHWFMQNLLTRKDTQTMANSLEARVPFADYKLIDYVYNVPKEMKYRNKIEKWLLRAASYDTLPSSILWRTKSPYPKTHDPRYSNIVKNKLINTLKKGDSIVQFMFDNNQLNNLISDNSDYIAPWFGQLMSKPQLIAYLLQLDLWHKKYNIKIII